MIPAPLLARQVAVAVIVVSLLGVAASLATPLVPIDGSVLWLVIVRQVVLAVQVAVYALAVFIVGRTLAHPTWAGFVTALGLLLFAVVLLAMILVATPWGIRPVVLAIEAAAVVAGVLMIGGLVGVGVAVLRAGAWPVVARVAPLAGAILLIPIGVAQALHTPLFPWFALWSVGMALLSVGLLTPRTVHVYGQPDTQQGVPRV